MSVLAKRATGPDAVVLLSSRRYIHSFDKRDLELIETGLANLEPGIHSPFDDYLTSVPPSWYNNCLKDTSGPPTVLDLSKEYLKGDYWAHRDGKNGMPFSHLWWCLHLLDVFPSIVSLDLSYCNIGDIGLAAIGSVLKTNTSLKNLALHDNSLTSTAIMAFVNLLSIFNHSVVSLSINESTPNFDSNTGKLTSSVPTLAAQERMPLFKEAMLILFQVNNSISKVCFLL